MHLRLLAPLVTLLLLAPVAASAQDFGVAESAETIDQGNFKLKINPILVFGRNGGDSEPGVAALIGYGVTRRFDVEGGVALYDGITIFGGTGEAWVVKEPNIDLSVIAGLHFRRGDNTADTTGVDFAVLASHHLTPAVEFYGALDFAFESVNNAGNFRTVHLVPGLEIRLSPDVDLLAEVGIALNDNARHYVSGGIAFYLR